MGYRFATRHTGPYPMSFATRRFERLLATMACACLIGALITGIATVVSVG